MPPLACYIVRCGATFSERISLQDTSIKWAEVEIPVSVLFPVSEQGYARRCKAQHSMVRVPPSPPFHRFRSVGKDRAESVPFLYLPLFT